MGTKIFFDSDKAAKPTTISGWVSAKGHFYTDESLARYDGCTHYHCKCGRAEYERGWTCCEICRSEKKLAEYLKMPEVPFETVDVFCLFDGDRYFFNEEDFLDWCADSNLEPHEVKLLACEGLFPNELDPNDLFCDLLAEDQTVDDVAPEISAAFEKLNEAIRNHKRPLSWQETKSRTSYPKAAP